MNTVIANMIERRSVRKFRKEQIAAEELEQILQAAQYAPTGMDRQHLVYVAVQEEETLKILRRMNGTIMGNPESDPYYGAPTIVLVLADASVSTGVEDGSLALGNMMNAAHSLGVGSCWIHRAREMFESAEGKALLKKWDIDGEYQGIGACALGYADGPLKTPSPRREKIVFVK